MSQDSHAFECPTCGRNLPAPLGRYRVNGQPVTREQAVRAWHQSRTYLQADPKTRGMIFVLADRGKDNAGEIAHLAEAGITIAQDHPRKGATPCERSA